MRLDKYLCDAQIGTRSEVKAMVRKKMVTVNGQLALKSDIKVDEAADTICVNGKEVRLVGNVYYMLHKPAGYVSSTDDHDGENVMSLLGNAPGKDLFPVGRLDKDTEGLLLITNDGKLSHRLLSPKKHVPKKYYAKVEGALVPEDVAAFENGMDLGDFTAKPAELEILTSGDISEALVTITEGKFHQVKRMFHACGKEVI
ncbi:MAG: rRNA pseudouridine synthase, partial [Lachnospiraceae bacterium]|nr:rRNA pseudouridine synthase [Candidatus Equihabitans merdae]